MDARLEYGVEMGVEISLRILSTVGMYNLPHSINATVHVSLSRITLFFSVLFVLFKIEKLLLFFNCNIKHFENCFYQEKG